MSDSFVFDTVSPRFSLPFLFAGQSQKESFVNEAHALTDALVHCAVEGTASQPPTDPEPGETWLIGETPSGDWAGHEGEIGSWQAGNWLFVAPRDGFVLLDRSTGQMKRYFASWQFPSTPVEPTGGMTVDTEARAAIADLIDALRVAGLFPTG